MGGGCGGLGGFCGPCLASVLPLQRRQGRCHGCGVHPILGLATAASWLIVAVFFRYSSLAALCAAVFAPFYFAIGQGLVWPSNPELLGALVIMSAVLIQRHKDNLKRLIRGEETRIGQKKN